MKSFLDESVFYRAQFIERAWKHLEKSNLELQRSKQSGWPKGKLDWKHCAQKRDRRPPTQPAARLDVGAELKRMQVVIDDLLWERSQWKGHATMVRRVWWRAHDPSGCGDTRGQSLRAFGSCDQRSRKQTFSCGGCEFCLSRGSGTFLRCAALYDLRGIRIGEVAHPGPPRLRILLESASEWSQVDPTSTVVASQRCDCQELG